VDAKDRHVVATAIVALADAIVTFNVKDFAADPCSVDEIVKHLQASGLEQTSLWLNTRDVAASCDGEIRIHRRPDLS